jgi:TonB-linked SusC/RagA family outer membrane protein
MSKLQLFNNVKWWKTICLIAMISLVSAAAFAQGITVRGRVMDDKGEPLVGATIKATGTQNAVTADASGNFSLTVPAGTASVTITFIGYVDVVKPVAANIGTVTMAANARDLNEVVVIGYGTAKRTDVTGTVTSVDAKTLQEIPSSSVVNQLQGRVAGLDVVGGSIRIRGTRTIGNPGADGPLIVVDGVPYYGGLGDINPNDIKTVDVLKGASSTAIYGSRGSGGVILITTNRGRVGRTQTAYDAYVGLSRLEGKLKTLDAAGYVQLKADALEGSILQSNGNAQSYGLTPIERQALADGKNVDWVNEIVKQQVIFDQTLRVSSGTEKTQFNTQLGYRTTQNGSLQPGNKDGRVTMNVNIDHQINKYIKFGVQTRNTLNMNNSSGGNEMGNAQWMSPLAYVYNPDGTLNLRPIEGQLDAATANPLLRSSLPSAYYNYNRGWQSDNIVYAELKPVNHLTYRYTINYNYGQSTGNNYNGINGVGIVNIAATSASTSNNTSYRVAQEHNLTYANTFGKHNVTATGVFTAERGHNEGSSFSGIGIPSDANRNANIGGLAATSTVGGGSWTETGLLSYVGRVAYTFDSKYSITGTMRADGNSTLATGNQWTSYPSVGVRWNLTNEDFMKKYDFIDNLALRAGYGENSTTSSGAYGTLGQLQNSPYQFGGGSAGNKQGVRVTNLVNTKLTWQRSHESNLALDFALFKNRITGSIDAYYVRTTDIILGNILPETTGASAQSSNLGISENKGIEFTLSTVNIQNLGGFTWSSDFNIGFGREKIVELPNKAPVNIGAGLFVGQPQGVIYDVRKLGIWQISDSQGIDVAKTNALNSGGTVYLPVRGQTSPLQYPGQIRVKDVDGNGIINSDDNQIIGHFNPNYTFGFTNRFNYKSFDLSLVITARMGFTTLVPYVSSANSNAEGWQFLNMGRHNQPVIDYWTPRNPTNAFPMPNNQFQSQYYSTLQYYDGSFIRARAINFGYNVPSGIVKRLGLTSLRVYGNVTNPFTIYSPASGYSFSVTDPESSGVTQVNPTTGGNISRNVGLNAGTQTRQFIFGINARF